MKKLKVLFVALMALVTTTAWAQLTDGDYFIQNVGSGAWLGGANSWGTQASTIEHPMVFTLKVESAGVYSLHSHTYNNNDQHFFTGTYVDGAKTNLYIREVNSGIYTISTADGSAYAKAASNSIWAIVANDGSDPSSTLAQWRFISKNAILASCKNATPTNPVDMTGFIKAANFGRNHFNPNFENAWTRQGYNTTDAVANCNISGGDNTNCCAESWKSSNGFNIYQTIIVPNGTYKFKAQAAYNDYDNLGTDLPVVYCNDVTVSTNPLANGEDNLAQLSNNFKNGQYNTPEGEVTVTNRTITIGIKSSRTNIWCMWDNFQLYYVSPLDLSYFQTTLQNAVNEAKGLKDKAMNATVLTNLTKAITDYDNAEYDNEDGYTAAIEKANTAVNNAKASIAIYEQIAALNAKVAAYDEDGKASYATTLSAYNNRTLADYKTAYNAFKAATMAQTTPGSDMTGAIDNPNFDGNINGWTDGFTGKLNHGYQNNSSYTNGDATISEFMECWAGQWCGAIEPYVLPNGKLYQKIVGLREGEYTMSADIIACQQEVGKEGYVDSKANFTGIYIFAESDAIFKSKACATENNLPEKYSFNFKMKGESLDLGLLIENTNCNWVAFDNVTLTYNGPLQGNIYQDALVEALKAYSDRSDEHAQKTLKEAYATALAYATTASTTNDKTDKYYQDALTNLSNASEALTSSANAYAKLHDAFTPYLENTKAAELVSEAKGIYNNEEKDTEYVLQYAFDFTHKAFIAVAETPFTSSAIAAGTYYLYNVEAGKFLNGANDWGSKMSLCEVGQPMILAASGDGYTIDSQISNGGDNHFINTGVFCDAAPYTFTLTNIGSNFFTISWDNGKNMYGYDGTNSVVAIQAVEAPGSYWQLVTREEIIKVAKAKASSEKPFDVSSLVLDNSFSRNNTLQSNWKGMGKKDGDVTNFVVEVFQKTFNSYQTLTGMPNGIYRMTAQGFYRQDGSDNEHLPVFYANGEEKTFPLRTGTENDMTAASTSFTAGKYTIEPIEFVVYDGTITLGAKLDVNTLIWSIWDNFRLDYCGEGEDIDATIAESGLSTFSSKYAVTIPEGVKAYKATSATDAYVHMEEITGQIPAQTGVVLVGTPSQTYTFGYYGENLDAITDNKLVAATNAIQLDPTSGDNTNYVLVGGEFHPFTGKATLAAGKAYLSLPTAVSAKSLFLDFGTADGIESISTKTANEGLFNLAGQAVGYDFKGIVIKNGKKMLNK